MGLVEETAAYLDGPGRAASKRLSRAAALAYAGESMRLTTRLMQVASWLLVQRAVRDGEIQLTEAASEKYRLISREPQPRRELRRQRRTARSAEDADHPRRRHLRTRAPAGRDHVRRRRRRRQPGVGPDGEADGSVRALAASSPSMARGGCGAQNTKGVGVLRRPERLPTADCRLPTLSLPSSS